MINANLKEDFDDEFVSDLLKSYVKGGKESLENIQSAMTNDDHKSISFWAHKLKGSSRMIGAKQIEELSSSIEKRATNKDILLRDDIEDLGEKFDALVLFIENQFPAK
ncbi:MAG: Hpt domain-containing protein [Flavobacteriales bacterium]|nr:Hpt domain-containing protein [Flavobacteriales bacterium]